MVAHAWCHISGKWTAEIRRYGSPNGGDWNFQNLPLSLLLSLYLFLSPLRLSAITSSFALSLSPLFSALQDSPLSLFSSSPSAPFVSILVVSLNSTAMAWWTESKLSSTLFGGDLGGEWLLWVWCWCDLLLGFLICSRGNGVNSCGFFVWWVIGGCRWQWLVRGGFGWGERR